MALVSAALQQLLGCYLMIVACGSCFHTIGTLILNDIKNKKQNKECHLHVFNSETAARLGSTLIAFAGAANIFCFRGFFCGFFSDVQREGVTLRGRLSELVVDIKKDSYEVEVLPRMDTNSRSIQLR